MSLVVPTVSFPEVVVTVVASVVSVVATFAVTAEVIFRPIVLSSLNG